ncbi:GlxA family transcriptional regulator [Kutzneria kofuensis]|uniref:Transcriptional regulator GlxA family with amidase domain n=1 Tax=Kutzneria kofuensis TaxID=103725 RepID=A0A7W9NKF9_9PSEU|nr:GlxA family transcriptional regulator [Kutzneria kofuensis]MBB5895223.1 transcriptional regulator GlxA family with amidase domain [Kutzneria kofuensis]
MSRHLVVVLAFDGVQLLDVAGPVDVLTSANEQGADYQVLIASADGTTVTTSAGVRIAADTTFDDVPRKIGTIIVPGRPDWQRAVADRPLVEAVRDLAKRSQRVASVCAGAFPLAESGLLDGRRAATHWQLADDLARRYPGVTVEPDPLFVRDGKIITSAGVTAGIDLTVALVEDDHGADVARAVARQLVVFMARPGGQSQFSARLGPRNPRSGVVRQVMDAIVADPAGPHRLPELAARVGMSGRHLARLFSAEIGRTPAEFVDTVRVEAARALLEGGTDSVDLIARRVGLGSAETLRRLFLRTLSVTPTAYRARFRTSQR